MGQLIKNIEVVNDRRSTIKEISRIHCINLVMARNFLDDINRGKYNGRKIENHYWLKASDYFKVTFMEVELTKEEIEEKKLKTEAKAWEATLTDRQREYIRVLTPIAFACG